MNDKLEIKKEKEFNCGWCDEECDRLYFFKGEKLQCHVGDCCLWVIEQCDQAIDRDDS